ncbi:MAG: helix-turn-helix domain-containing protein [Bacteroidota bacterium]|nr:helix-turn-helix domain-containing protein [Bacteroidota bacterium]MDP3144280.1 helix-turn-helix domain-containing protein [Bacteroidota bacterium]
METHEQVEQLQQDVAALKTEVNELKEIVKGSVSEKMFTVAQAAVKLGLKPSGVNWHIRKNALKASGKRYKKIKESDLNQFIELNRKPEARA